MDKKNEQNKQMSLSESGRFDAANGARTKLTGWGIICKDRFDRKVSRKARRERKSEG